MGKENLEYQKGGVRKSNQGRVSGKNKNCKQISPWLSLPEHTVTPGEKSGKKKRPQHVWSGTQIQSI